MPSNKKINKDVHRYGIGEWYGKLFYRLLVSERQAYANIGSKKNHTNPCPFRTKPGAFVKCTKQGGVCSIRLYTSSEKKVSVCIDNPELVTTCPYRFWEKNQIFNFVSEHVLKTNHQVKVVKEVGFLETVTLKEFSGPKTKAGSIDMVLVEQDSDPLKWCGLELQAVYFSGDTMKKEYNEISTATNPEIVFPVGQRRPDFRSSGPKRLMPQLQTKVPTLRRWGKRMAVVIDRPFFDHLGPMDRINDLSNADIAWFIVNYNEEGSVAKLFLDDVQFTTLERAVEGLTAGIPIGMDKFEEEIVDTLKSNLQSKKNKIIEL